MNNKLCYSFVLVILLFTGNLCAQVRLPKIIGSNMVLQQNKIVPIWGFAPAGVKIKVSFGKQIKETVTDTSGHWMVNLEPMKASGKPGRLIISGKDTVITLVNILVGEVWLCSGQSNMEYTMKLSPKFAKPAKSDDLAAEELKKAHNPEIRIFLVEKKLGAPDVITKGWNIARDSALMPFSAIGYFFGKELCQKLNVPIGIISSSWGGSRIEPWTPAEAYNESPVFKEDVTKDPGRLDGIATGTHFRSMVQPLAPFTIRGFLWYQGESNCMLNETSRYTEKMKLLIDSWRSAWRDAGLPFYYVQIAPYYYTHRKDKFTHTPETLAEFWEAQTATLKIPNTGMIVVSDLVDNLADIHPSYKWEVGRRLSLWALAKEYGQGKLIYSGPMYKQMSIKGDKVEIGFTYGENGLSSSDGQSLTWFTIAGPDGKFVPARAVIEGNKVVVSSPEIIAPVAVRFAWDEAAMPNLVNKEGLPAVPFRTDQPEWIKNF
jgi:sialate O-acetylesterase